MALHKKKAAGFTHAVLFKIAPGQIARYRRDCAMWASYARKAEGFIGYCTLKRLGFKGQYASVYRWKTKSAHDRFMKKFHDFLVGRSKAKVKVEGYYNLKTVMLAQ